LAESSENAEYLGLLADRVAQTHVPPIDAAIRECCGSVRRLLLRRLGSDAPTADCSARI
jgi:hypothetical protein